MNSKLTPTRFDNPCPVCGKTNGNCRSNHKGLTLCMTFADAVGEKINGYKFIGKTKDGLWGEFILDSGDYSDEKKEQYHEYKQAQEKARQEQFKGSLSLASRDKNIKAIVKHLGLSETDRQKLRERGLTDEQIKEGYFATVKTFSELPSSISTRLAGIYVGLNGNPHIGSDYQQGILCPIFNADRLITGYQIRRDSKNNKYVWASTGEKKDAQGNVIRQKISSHLPNGELPINYHYCNDKENQTLWLNDGNMKTYIAHLLHQIDIVGCAGGNFASCLDQLLEITIKYRQFYYALDGGDILNRQVINRLKRLADTLKEHNIELQFAYWGQITKNGNDIDEIEKLEYKLLNIDELLELAQKEQFNAKKRAKLEKLTNFTSHITATAQYLSEIMENIDTEGKVTGINSAMNTGKSYWLQLLVHVLKKPIILIGSRQVLTCNLAGELKIAYCDKDYSIELVEALFKSNQGVDLRLGIVVDSLLKIREIDWNDAVVIIDEAEQFLEHLLLAKTHIEQVRGRVLGLLAEKLPLVNRIILMDADLSDFTCDYFHEISNLPLQKIKNKYQENYRNLFGYEHKDNLIAILNDKTAKKEHNLIVGDSAKELTAMYQLDIERGIKAILLTRENLSDHKSLSRFLENNGKAIRDEGIQNVYLSPVGQSGISIEIEYFDNVFGIFNGAIGTNIARQLLIRDRSGVDRHIWVADKGLGYTTDYDPEQILETQEFKETSLIESINYYQQLEGLGFDDALLRVTELRANNKECRDLNNYYRACLIAKQNLMKSDYSAILYDELAQQGYNIVRMDLLTTGNLDMIKEKKEELDIKQSQRVYVAPEIDEAEAEVLSNKDGLIESERDKLLKYRIRQYLPDFELNSDFILKYIIKDQWKTLKSITNYFLALHPDICDKLDFNSVNYALWQSHQNGIFWLNDSRNNKIIHILYESLGIGDFIQEEKITGEEIAEFREICRQNRGYLKLFGIKFSKKTQNGKLLSDVFRLFGYKSSRVSYKSKTGDYNILPVVEKDLFNQIYQSISQKYLQEIQVNYDIIQFIFNKETQTNAQQEVRVNNFSQDNFNNFNPSLPMSKPEIVNSTEKILLNQHTTESLAKITKNNEANKTEEINEDLIALIKRFNFKETLANCTYKVNQIVKLTGTFGLFRVLGFAGECIVLAPISTKINDIQDRMDFGLYDLRSVISS